MKDQSADGPQTTRPPQGAHGALRTLDYSDRGGMSKPAMGWAGIAIVISFVAGTPVALYYALLDALASSEHCGRYTLCAILFPYQTIALHSGVSGPRGQDVLTMACIIQLPLYGWLLAWSLSRRILLRSAILLGVIHAIAAGLCRWAFR